MKWAITFNVFLCVVIVDNFHEGRKERRTQKLALSYQSQKEKAKCTHLCVCLFSLLVGCASSNQKHVICFWRCWGGGGCVWIHFCALKRLSSSSTFDVYWRFVVVWFLASCSFEACVCVCVCVFYDTQMQMWAHVKGGQVWVNLYNVLFIAGLDTWRLCKKTKR